MKPEDVRNAKQKKFFEAKEFVLKQLFEYAVETAAQPITFALDVLDPTCKFILRTRKQELIDYIQHQLESSGWTDVTVTANEHLRVIHITIKDPKA